MTSSDGRLGTGPLLTMALLVLGFVGATWGVVHQVRDSIKRDKKE